MFDDDKRAAAERRAEIFRGAANQSFPDMMVDLHASVAIIGGPLAIMMTGIIHHQDDLMSLTPVEAVPAAVIGLAVAALMLLARKFDDWRKWAGLAFGLPVFLCLALVYAGVAASYVVVPAKAELAHLVATADHWTSAQAFARWLAFLDEHAGTPEAKEAAGIVARDMGEYEIPEQTPALLELYRRAPDRHAPILQALWERASSSPKLAEALAREGFTLESQPATPERPESPGAP